MSNTHWLEKSERILAFLRHSEQVAAVEKELWFFKGSAVDQLAAFLQRDYRDPVVTIEFMAKKIKGP